jgi:hypothetical protein
MPAIAGSSETAVIDSSEFISGRVALEFDKLGIHIREANWGDADIELFMIKQELGEIPAERHPPNRTVTLKLLVTRETGVTFAEALSKLQAKVNTLQESSGWIKRKMDYRGGFKRNIGAIVYKAALSGVDGWYMGHRAAAPEITLTMNCSPYFYATEEVEIAATSITGHDLEWEIPEPIGTAPGLLCLEISNNTSETFGDWHGAILAIESRDHSSAATAKLGYNCESLTKLGNAAAGSRPGSIGFKIVEAALTNSWQPVMGSKITASGAMSHIGPRNLLLRAYESGISFGSYSLKLQWKTLGSDYWSENEEQVTQASGFNLMFMGECRPEIATLGNQTWEWRLLGRSNTGGNVTAAFDKVWVLPTEQYLELLFEKEAEAFAPVVFEDKSHEEAQGASTGKTPNIGGKIETFGDAVVVEYMHDKSGKVEWSGIPGVTNYRREEKGDAKITEAGFAVTSTIQSGEQIFTGILAAFGPCNPARNFIKTVGGAFGYVLRFVNKENWLACVSRTAAAGTSLFEIVKCVAGVTTILAQTLTTSFYNTDSACIFKISINPAGTVSLTIEHTINPGTGKFESFTLTATDAALESTGTLKEGKTGIIDFSPGAEGEDAENRWYGSMLSIKPESEERGAVCYSGGKKLELRTDGCFREAVGEAAWARLTPVGFLPYLKPGGLEARPMKGVFIPTMGDFGSLPDAFTSKIELKIRYRPAYLFTSGAS